jgi:hypothetical protein
MGRTMAETTPYLVASPKGFTWHIPDARGQALCGRELMAGGTVRMDLPAELAPEDRVCPLCILLAREYDYQDQVAKTA